MAQLSYRKIPAALEQRKPFTGSSSQAMHVKSLQWVSPGRMSPESRDLLRKDVGAYVVFSYGTPIAWVTDDGEKCIPDESYSSTTSRIQNLCRSYL